MSDDAVREGLDKIRSLLNPERSVVAFVGAGMSVSSGLPSWANLLQRVTEKLESALPEDELREFLKRADPSSVVDLYTQHFGRDQTVRLFSDAVGSPSAPS